MTGQPNGDRANALLTVLHYLSGQIRIDQARIKKLWWSSTDRAIVDGSFLIGADIGIHLLVQHHTYLDDRSNLKVPN